MVEAFWYFDFISPYAYLQLPRILALRERIEISPVPILFSALLNHFGQLGPAEIPGKREFTGRFVYWQAERTGLELRFPPAHPFHPLAALRLCLAAGATWESVSAIYNHIWRYGYAGDTADALEPVAAQLRVNNVDKAINDNEVKMKLRSNTEAAIAVGVFGVPTVRVSKQLFWGNDATPMLEDFLTNPSRFDTPELRRLDNLPLGVQRRS